MKSFTGAELKHMNLKYPWQGSINLNLVKKPDQRYKLEATGECDLTLGRIYKAVPHNPERKLN